MKTHKFDRGDIVCTNINEVYRSYTVISYFYLEKEADSTDGEDTFSLYSLFPQP